MSNGERQSHDKPLRPLGAAHSLLGAHPASELIAGAETRHQSAQTRAIANMPAPNPSVQVRAIADILAPKRMAQMRAFADMATPKRMAQMRAFADMATPKRMAQMRVLADMATPKRMAQMRAFADIPTLKLNEQLATITSLSPLISDQHLKMAEIASPLSVVELNATAKAVLAVISPTVGGVRMRRFASPSRGMDRVRRVVHPAESFTHIQAEPRTAAPPEPRDRARETLLGHPGYADEVARPLNLRADPFLRACIEEVNRCLAEDRPVLAVDRAHSAVHRVLQLLAEEVGCVRDRRQTLTKLFRSVREHHPAFSFSGANDVAIELFGKLSSTLATLNELRNNHSYAHPTDDILSGPCARFAVTIALSMIELLIGLWSEYHFGGQRGDLWILN